MINAFDLGVKRGAESAKSNKTILQGIINSAKKTIYIPEDVHYNGALLIRDNTSIVVDDGASMILDQLYGKPAFNNWPMYSNILMGAWNKPNIDLLQSTNEMKDGAVWLRSLTTFNVGPSVIPTYGQLNIIKDGKFVYDVQIDDFEIVPLSDNGNNIFGTNEPQYYAHNARIKGGNWINNVLEGAFSTGTGIGCHVDVDKIVARNGIGYGNMLAYGELKCREMLTRKAIVELAMNSHDNNVSIHYAECSGETRKQSQAAIWINEGSRNNQVNINTAISNGEHIAGVMINAASGNHVDINTFTANNVKRDFDIRSSNFKGIKPKTENNHISVNNLNGANKYESLPGNTITINGRVQ